MARLLHWLSTLRRDCYRPTTQDSLRLLAPLYRVGFEPTGSNERFQSHVMFLFPLSQARHTTRMPSWREDHSFLLLDESLHPGVEHDQIGAEDVGKILLALR